MAICHKQVLLHARLVFTFEYAKQNNGVIFHIICQTWWLNAPWALYFYADMKKITLIPLLLDLMEQITL